MKMLRVPTLSKLFNVSRPNPDPKSLSRKRIAEVLALYPQKEVGELISCLPLGGNYSHNLLLKTTVGQKVLKKYKYHDLSSILPEHSILTFLADHDFPAPRLVRNKEGHTYSEVNGWFWALYDFIVRLSLY